MLNSLFRGLFDSPLTEVIAPVNFLICIGVSLVIGLMLSVMCQWKSRTSESFSITLALLPATVCAVIMMVNGNIGAGVAVAGAFGLVRFRSVAGNGREISSIFIAMCSGLIAGMGYLAYAFLFSLILGGMMMIYSSVLVKKGEKSRLCRQLRITIPENLNYTDVFDSILQAYTSSYSLKQVKTTNMGSLYKLVYDITLIDGVSEKNMIDDLRCRNGNLEISLNYQETEVPSL